MEFEASLLAEHEIVVECPIQNVFSFVSNMENFGLWFPEVVEIVSENGLDHGTIGKTYSEMVNLPPNGEQKLRIEVKNAEPPTFFATESEYYPLFPRMTIKLKKKDDGFTQVCWKMVSRSKDANFVNHELPNFKTLIDERAAIAVQNLKELLENK